MNDKVPRLFEQLFLMIKTNLMPCILLGIAIAFMLGIFILFSYVLLWGLIIGAALWIISIIKQYFYPTKRFKQTKPGRIIDHDKSK